MTREEYKKRYVKYLVEQSRIKQAEAEENFENGTFDENDLEIGDPEGAAADEISYWMD